MLLINWHIFYIENVIMNPLLHIIKNIIINLPRNQTISKNLKKSKSCTKKNKGSRCLCGGQIGQRNGPYHMDDTVIYCIKNDINKMVLHGIKRGLLITCQ